MLASIPLARSISVATLANLDPNTTEGIAMSETVAKLAARKGRVPALVASLAILGWMIISSLVQTLINVGWYFSSVSPTDLGQGVGGGWWPSFGGEVLGSLVVALGIFVSLWAIAPISHELDLPFVLTRAALATACGAVLSALVHIVIALFSAIRAPEYWFSNSFTPGGFEGGMFLSSVIGSLIGIITTSIALFPLVALTVVLLWLWLRAHPREYEISGLIDEL
jgi:hypothetical protein